MKICVISGSNRIGRKSHLIAENIVVQLKAQEGVSHVELLDVKEYSFPVMDERLSFLDEPHQGLKRFSEHLYSCDGLIVVTPEYNGGMAGSLKNTLDYFRKEFERKPMAAVTVSSGGFGGVNALHQLWFWMSYVGGIVSPTKLLVSQVGEVFDENGGVKMDRYARNSAKMIEDFLWLVGKISQ